MRDLVLTAIVFGSLPVILMRPWVGVLMWVWLSVMNPHRLTWSFAYDMPFAQMAGIALLIGFLFSKEPKKMPSSTLVVVWVLFVLWMCVTTAAAFNVDYAMVGLEKSLKIQIPTFLALMIMYTRERLNLLVWVLTLSLAFFGTKGGVFTILHGGNFLVWGPAGTFISGNNELALALVTIIPLLRFLQMQVRNRWISWGFVASMVLCGASVIGSHSRGAFLAAIMMGLFLVWKSRKRAAMLAGLVLLRFLQMQVRNRWISWGLTASMVLCAASVIGSHSRGAFLAAAMMGLFLVWKSRKRAAMLAGLALLVPLVLAMAPDKYWARMESIKSYEEDTSAQGRINAWTFAVNLANDYPITGGGFNTFQRVHFARYAPDPSRVHDAHSNYFKVLAEHGYVGLGLYLAILVLTYRQAGRTARAARKDPTLTWHADLARMSQAAMVGYHVGGAFLGLPYFDLFYYLVAITVLNAQLVDKAIAQRVPAPVSPYGPRPASLGRPVMPHRGPMP